MITIEITTEQAQLITESILKNITELYKQTTDKDQDTIEALDDILPIMGAATEKPEEPNGAEGSGPPILYVNNIRTLKVAVHDLIMEHGDNLVFTGLGVISVIDPETGEILSYIKYA